MLKHMLKFTDDDVLIGKLINEIKNKRIKMIREALKLT